MGVYFPSRIVNFLSCDQMLHPVSAIRRGGRRVRRRPRPWPRAASRWAFSYRFAVAGGGMTGTPPCVAQSDRNRVAMWSRPRRGRPPPAAAAAEPAPSAWRPWLVLADLCQAVGIANPRTAAGRLAEHEKGVHIADTLGGPQQGSDHRKGTPPGHRGGERIVPPPSTRRSKCPAAPRGRPSPCRRRRSPPWRRWHRPPCGRRRIGCSPLARAASMAARRRSGTTTRGFRRGPKRAPSVVHR